MTNAIFLLIAHLPYVKSDIFSFFSGISLKPVLHQLCVLFVDFILEKNFYPIMHVCYHYNVAHEEILLSAMDQSDEGGDYTTIVLYCVWSFKNISQIAFFNQASLKVPHPTVYALSRNIHNLCLKIRKLHVNGIRSRLRTHARIIERVSVQDFDLSSGTAESHGAAMKIVTEYEVEVVEEEKQPWH